LKNLWEISISSFEVILVLGEGENKKVRFLNFFLFVFLDNENIFLINEKQSQQINYKSKFITQSPKRR